MKLVLLFALAASLAVIQAAPYHGTYPSAEEMIAYVNSIELAEPKFKIRRSNMSFVKVGVTPPDKQAEGYVDGGELAAFTEQVQGTVKQDILYSSLFAQLASDKMYDKEKDPVNWYKYYVNLLSNLGYTLQGFNFHDYTASGKSFTMDKAVIEILRAIAKGGQAEVIEATLSALEGLADDDNRIRIFSQQSTSYTNGAFQVFAVDQAPSGEVAVAMGVFYFSASQKRTNFLFFEYGSSSTHLHDSAQSAVFLQDLYGRVRSSVANKLGRSIESLVDSITL